MFKEVEKLIIKGQKEIEDRIKMRIKNLGLVSSGSLINSIKVKINLSNDGKSFSVDIDAVDYFEFLDKKYNIIDYVLEIKEVNDIILDIIATFVLLNATDF